MIKSKDWKGAMCTLKYADGTPVALNEPSRPRDGDGSEFLITGGHAPRTEASTGKVYVKLFPQEEEATIMEYYPSVINAKWVED